VDFKLAFIGYIRPSFVLPVIVLTLTYQFAFLVVLLVMLLFTVRLVFIQLILTVL